MVLHTAEGIVSGRAAANLLAKTYQRESEVHLPMERTKEVRKQIKAARDITNRRTPESCMTEKFTLQELEDGIRKLKTKKAPGADGITNEFLKHLGPTAKILLLSIYNESWDSGLVPSTWKEAHIQPVLKKGKDKKGPENYRPISLLSCTGKLMERLINRRLMWFLETNSALSPTQTGYRQFRNTEDQLTYLSQDIENAFQDRKKVLAIFFDLSRAFDTVWKEGLHLKLLQAGVTHKMYSWIKSFLFRRTARVKADGYLSKQVKLREGVPQGSVIAPTLFLVYINEITTTCHQHVSNTLHADDFAVWTASEHTTTASYLLQKTVDKVEAWTTKWGLKLNHSKTTATLFSLSPNKEKINIKINNQPIPQTDTPTFLGVTLDRRLTWKPHTETTIGKAVRKLAIMKKLAGTTWGADSKILKQVYTGAVRPIMEYASSTWATMAKTTKEKLDKIQNMGLRITLGAMKTCPIREMEKTADIEPLELRRPCTCPI